MRWAFWRKRNREAQAEASPTTGGTPASGARPPGGRQPAGRDDPDEPPVGGPAFSGASPQTEALAQPAPATSPAGEQVPAGFVTAHGADGTSADVELEPLRADLVALVRAIELGDRDDIDALRRRICGYSSPAAGFAFIGGLAVLGERFLVAAGIPPGEGPPGSPGCLAAVAAGDRAAARAQPLLSELLPAADPQLVPWLVRFSVGMPELAGDPHGAMFSEGEETPLALAVLLAQTCIDGQGTPEDVGAEFVALFSG